MQFAPAYQFNAFDLQVGCEYPLPLEKAFLQNFLALLTLPPEETQPFEGMAQMISLVIDEAYRRWDRNPAWARRSVTARASNPWSTWQSPSTTSSFEYCLCASWRHVVTALCEVEDFRLAEIPRSATPCRCSRT